MEKGQLRVDLQHFDPAGIAGGIGSEDRDQNMNSVSGVRRSLFEIERQIKALERGERLQQETRGWNDDTGETF